MVTKAPGPDLAKLIRGSPRLFLIFLCGLGLNALYWGKIEIDIYNNKILIRDFGVRGFGVVTAHTPRQLKQRSELDYIYRPILKNGTLGSILLSHGHEVRPETFTKYPVGSKIPIKTNPNDPKDTHLDVQGYWSNPRLMVSGFILFLYYSFATSIPIFIVWWAIAAFSNRDLNPPMPKRPDATIAAADAFFDRTPH